MDKKRKGGAERERDKNKRRQELEAENCEKLDVLFRRVSSQPNQAKNIEANISVDTLTSMFNSIQ